MKLISVEIEGYRRFNNKQQFQLDGRVIALLGPNEAGKTSLLRALESLNDKREFATRGPSQDISRDLNVADNDPIVTAKLLLEEHDLSPIHEIANIENIRWALVKKLCNGKKVVEFIQPVERDNTTRNTVIKKIEKNLNKIKNRANMQLSNDEVSFLMNLENSLSEANHEEDTLSPFLLDNLKRLSSSLQNRSSTALQNLIDEIEWVVENELKEHPSVTSEKLILKNMPRFLLFSEEDRLLESSYDLANFYGSNKNVAVPRALQNLANFGDINLPELYRACIEKDSGRKHMQVSVANNNFKQKLNTMWNQSDVYVNIEVNGTRLTILAGSTKTHFENIAERSDGLRQFVALVAFHAKNTAGKGRTILLIDEAEAHLHYDAQADLIQMLTKQQLSEKVIYTTHSLGCLPEDLGLGVRLVQPVEGGTTKSKILNKFWAEDSIGLSPVLFGMGASTMAFLPVRYCVLVEGPADFLLLPALLREASNQESLGYQISPGLAVASNYDLSIIKNEGSRVTYLVDGDTGGEKIRKKLKRQGVDSRKIISLKDAIGIQCVVEDLVDKELYVASINEELNRSGYNDRLTAKELPDSFRASSVENWCKKNGLNVPSKVSIAYRILDQVHEQKLIDTERAEGLQNIHKALMDSFGP